jgi:hypothetical protein
MPGHRGGGQDRGRRRVSGGVDDHVVAGEQIEGVVDGVQDAVAPFHGSESGSRLLQRLGDGACLRQPNGIPAE